MAITLATTTVTTVMSFGFVSIVALIITITLVVLLIGREIATSVQGEHEVRWGQALDTAIVPLVICFGVILILTLLMYV